MKRRYPKTELEQIFTQEKQSIKCEVSSYQCIEMKYEKPVLEIRLDTDRLKVERKPNIEKLIRLSIGDILLSTFMKVA